MRWEACTHTRSHRKIDFLQNSAASLALENIFSKNNIRPGHVSVRFLREGKLCTHAKWYS